MARAGFWPLRSAWAENAALGGSPGYWCIALALPGNFPPGSRVLSLFFCFPCSQGTVV